MPCYALKSPYLARGWLSRQTLCSSRLFVCSCVLSWNLPPTQKYTSTLPYISLLWRHKIYADRLSFFWKNVQIGFQNIWMEWAILDIPSFLICKLRTTVVLSFCTLFHLPKKKCTKFLPLYINFEIFWKVIGFIGTCEE